MSTGSGFPKQARAPHVSLIRIPRERYAFSSAGQSMRIRVRLQTYLRWADSRPTDVDVNATAVVNIESIGGDGWYPDGKCTRNIDVAA